MASDRSGRFLRIERPRAADAGGGAEPAPGTAERFAGVERPTASPSGPRTSGAELDRFGPPPDPPIELLETSAGQRPFTRCMGCGMDSGAFATECSGCGARLDTDAQREFNERLWATRQAESAREARSAGEREALRARAEAELSDARRAMGEQLAREIGDRERGRLRAESGWGGLGGGFGAGGAPLAVRLLRALPDWRWQLGAIAAGVAGVGGLAAAGLHGHPFALLLALVVTAALLVPPWRTDGW